jgi:2-polyprenyl-3-methyl-5-hydroxy-6-metoxy-1,4-benzoquinol methylase
VTVTKQQVEAGQAVYTRRALKAYDLVVLTVSNRWIWKCPTAELLQHYNQHVSANHLDVGVGSGYFPDRCRFPSPEPKVALMDLNPETLQYASQRIARYQPTTYRRNVLQPIEFDDAGFDSVSINYLLHCLPGTMQSKAVVFDHLKPLMNPGAVLYGSTLLHEGVPRNWIARRLMNVYNRKGIFSNQADSLEQLQMALHDRFQDVTVKVIGCAALFSGQV